MIKFVSLLGILCLLVVVMTAGCISQETITPVEGPQLSEENSSGMSSLSNFERHASISKIGTTEKNEVYYSFEADTFASVEAFVQKAKELAVEESDSKLQPYPVTKIEFTTVIAGENYTLVEIPGSGATLNGKTI